MDVYKSGILVFIIGNLLVFSITIFHIAWISILFYSGTTFYDNFGTADITGIQAFFLIFLALSIFNIIIYVYCIYNNKNLSLKGQIIILPFLLIIIVYISSVLYLEIHFDTGFQNIYIYRDYANLILISDIVIFIGVYFIIKDKFS